MQDHHIASRKKDLERIAENKSAAINVRELFEHTKLIDLFPKVRTVLFVTDTDTLPDALAVIVENSVQSVPVRATPSKKFSKFLDVLDVVHFLHSHLKEKKISEEEASKLKLEEFLKDIHEINIKKVAATNTRANFYPFEGSAPIKAVLERMVESNLHRVPILDQDGELYGICSQTDIIHFIQLHKGLFIEHWDKTIEQLNMGLHTVHTIHSTDLVIKGFELIKEKQISGIGVVGEKGELVGVLSGSDIKLIGAHLKDLHKVFLPFKVAIESARKPIAIHKDGTFGQIVDLFVQEKVHRILVTEPNSNNPIGIISMVDLLKIVSSDFK